MGVVQTGGIDVVGQTVVSGIVHEGGRGIILILLRVSSHARDVTSRGRPTKSWQRDGAVLALCYGIARSVLLLSFPE
jgi:hypothetical protein